jgi:DnaK suppressor protein
MPKASTSTGSKTIGASAPKDASKSHPAALEGGPAPDKASGRKAASAKSDEAAAPADRFLAEQRALLLSERATYVDQAESLQAEAEQLAEDMEPGDIQFDEESGEGGTMNIERERDLVLSAQARAAVDEIDQALTKIDLGTYGFCAQCGNPIPKARLKALPYAALCVACKSGGLSRR